MSLPAKKNYFFELYHLAGLFALGLRLVVGWTYFSAFWRRLILENKLDEHSAEYIGEKLNHFLPHALGLQNAIAYLVTHPDLLWVAMLIFTIAEGLAGLCFMLGFFTRLASAVVALLAFFILLSAGWLGTTCLDEWQIGVLGIAAAVCVFFCGGGRHSLDFLLISRNAAVANMRIFTWVASGVLPLSAHYLRRSALIASAVVLLLTLATNQYFHGGLWGKLHNKSVRPHIAISHVTLKDSTLSFEIFRDEGTDVYGSFLIGITLYNAQKKHVLHLTQYALSHLNERYIKNYYVARVHSGKHSLVVPLGARARLSVVNAALAKLPKVRYQLVLTDISGITWTAELSL